VILTDNDTTATIETGAPVLWRLNIFEPVKLSDSLEPLVYELPGAWPVRTDFAAIFP
jgi:hypothetical protein